MLASTDVESAQDHGWLLMGAKRWRTKPRSLTSQASSLVCEKERPCVDRTARPREVARES